MRHSRKKETHFIYKVIFILIFVVLSAAFFFSFQSPVLSLDTLSSQFIAFSVLIFFALLFFVSWKQGFWQRGINKFLTDRKLELIFWIVFALIIIYQIVLISAIQAKPMLDSLVVTFVDKGSPLGSAGLNHYLSIYPNNLFISLVNWELYRLIPLHYSGMPSPLLYQVFTALQVNLTLVLIKQLSEKLFQSKRIGIVAAFLFSIFAILQPVFLVPYTDTYGLLPLFLSLLLLLYAKNSRKTSMRLILAAFSGLFATVSYLYRPSLLVPFVALIILIALKARRDFFTKKYLFLTLAFVCGCFIFLFPYTLYLRHQTVVKIDSNLRYPVANWLLIGSYGNENNYNSPHGTWNVQDNTLMTTLPTPQARETAALRAFVARTEKRGFSNTLKFYIQKFRDNIDTGAQYHLVNGLWLQPIDAPPNIPLEQLPSKYFAPANTLSYVFQQLFFANGSLHPAFNYILQLAWLFLLFFALYGLWKYRADSRVFLLGLTVFGGLLFLELFESGGTRFFFQYLPFLCMLSAVGLCKLLKK